MVQLADIQRQAAELSEEDRKCLVAYLLHEFTGAPLGPDDEEIERREAEILFGTNQSRPWNMPAIIQKGSISTAQDLVAAI